MCAMKKPPDVPPNPKHPAHDVPNTNLHAQKRDVSSPSSIIKLLEGMTATDRMGKTHLHQAAERGDIDAVRTLMGIEFMRINGVIIVDVNA